MCTSKEMGKSLTEKLIASIERLSDNVEQLLARSVADAVQTDPKGGSNARALENG